MAKRQQVSRHKGKSVTIWLEPEQMDRLNELVKCSQLDKSKVLKLLIQWHNQNDFLAHYVAHLQQRREDE